MEVADEPISTRKSNNLSTNRKTIGQESYSSSNFTDSKLSMMEYSANGKSRKSFTPTNKDKSPSRFKTNTENKASFSEKMIQNKDKSLSKGLSFQEGKKSGFSLGVGSENTIKRQSTTPVSNHQVGTNVPEIVKEQQ
jgi:hypothetical protein